MSGAEKRFYILREDLKRIMANFTAAAKDMGLDSQAELQEVISEVREI